MKQDLIGGKMPAYFDSSLLISILKPDPEAEHALTLWEHHQDRVSSLILEAECLTVLRRLENRFRKHLPQKWRASSEEQLNLYLSEINLQKVDEEIILVLRHEKRLAGCRTLDALHVATALFFQEETKEELVFCSFDREMNHVASLVGLQTID